MKYCVTIHIEIEADNITSACSMADDITEAIYNLDIPEVAIDSVTIGDVEELLEDE